MELEVAPAGLRSMSATDSSPVPMRGGEVRAWTHSICHKGQRCYHLKLLPRVWLSRCFSCWPVLSSS